MAVAKNPGIGQGKGGGRPKREAETTLMQFSLTHEAAEMVKAQAKATKQPAWKIVDSLIRTAFEMQPLEQEQPQAPPLPKEAMDIAQEVSDFLTSHQDNPKALKALQRAWKQTILLAMHDIKLN